MISSYRGISPEIDPSVFLAETSVVVGDVQIGPESSVWYGAVVRGDESPIRIGRGSCVQDNCVLHCDENSPMVIGDNVTIGHGAIVHGATIGNNVLIGMGAIVLNGASVGDNTIIGAGAVVKENAVIPENVLVVGVPGKVVKTLGDEQIAALQQTSDYVALSRTYLAQQQQDLPFPG